jgi:hypothetical protein
MVVNGYSFNGNRIQVDGLSLIRTFSNPAEPNILLNELIGHLYRIDLSEASKAQIKRDILLSGQSSDHYWTDAWNLMISNPSNTANTTTVRNKVRDLIKYLMNLAEYQLA